MKKKIDFSKMSTFTCNFIGAVIATIVAFLCTLPWGVGYAIDWVTNLILYTVIIECSLDLVIKLKNQKELLCWQYYVGLVAILLSNWSFMATAKQTENKPFFIWLSITAALTAVTGIWWNKAVKGAYEKKKEIITEVKEN